MPLFGCLYALYINGVFYRRWTQPGIALAEAAEWLAKGCVVEIRPEVNAP